MNKKKDRRSYKNCCSAGCLNTTYNCDLTFFSLPSDAERRNLWLKLLLREDLEDTNSLHYRVCEKHFDSESILITPTRKLLTRRAVPCRLLPEPRDAAPAQPAADRRCANCKPLPQPNPPQPSNDARNPQKRKPETLNSDVPDSKKINIFFELCDRFLSKKLAKIVKEQSKINFYDFRNRYSIGYKVFCLNLYRVSPHAYNLLSDTLCLPHRTSLVRMCEPMITQPDHIMEALKIKAARMTDRDKHCCVFIDAIKLKRNLYYSPKEDKIYGFHHEEQVRPLGLAEYAVVAVVQGIFGDYRQPAGYTMLAADADSARVAAWTDHLIHQLCAVGLNVRALMTGSSFQFINTAKTRQVTVASPYFFVNNRKIFYMFDPAQLIVETRDSLMMYDFHFNSSVAKWDDIRQFYENDSAQQLPLAPRLTDCHLEPSGPGRRRARLAAQVFAGPVAAGMATYASLGALGASAHGTIDLITKINDLVQFFNLSSKHDCPSHRNDFSDQVHKVYFINSMLNFFSILKVIDEINGIDVTSLVTFIESFQITLKSILHLYVDFEINGFTYELTRQLNRDYINNFIDSVKKTYANAEATSWILVTEFRKSYLGVFFKSQKKEEHSDNYMNALFDNPIATPRRNHTPANGLEASAKKKKLSSVLPRTATVNDTQQIKNSILSQTFKQEAEMEVDDDITAQIKKEQEDFLNMDIEIEEHEITISSRQQEDNNELLHIKQEDDSLTRHSSRKQEDKIEEICKTQQIKQKQEDLLSSSFEMEGDELIISSREQEHNYGSNFIKQEPDNNTEDYSWLIQHDKLYNIAEGSTSEDESTISSAELNKPEQQDIDDDSKSEEEIPDDCLLRPSMQRSNDILEMLFILDEKQKKEPYEKCKYPIRTTDYSIQNLPKKNGLVYISVWLLQRCRHWHKDCDDFNAYIEVNLAQNPNNTQYSRYKDYCKQNGVGLSIIPRDDFIEYVKLMDRIFCEIFKKPQIHSRNVLGSVLGALELTKVSPVMPCCCFPIDYCRQLFFRIRLHYTLEYNNKHIHKAFVVQKL